MGAPNTLRNKSEVANLIATIDQEYLIYHEALYGLRRVDSHRFITKRMEHMYKSLREQFTEEQTLAICTEWQDSIQEEKVNDRTETGYSSRTISRSM